jgi:hypothetical protein
MVERLCRPLVFLAALAIGVVAPLPARAAADLGSEAESPSLEYDKSVGLPLFAGAIAAVALPAMVYKTPPACRWCDGAKVDVIDRWARKAKWEEPCRAARLSYASLGAAGAVALLPMSREASGSEWLTNAGAVADSVAVTVMLTQFVKYTVRRARPEADTCHPGRSKEQDRNLSFFSGHTAIAFALVSSAHETARLRGHATSDWIWAGGAAAAATAYLRMAGGRHYLIDVLAGAGVGYLVGRWIPRQVTRPTEPQSTGPGVAFRSSLSPSLFAWSRSVGSDGNVLLQLGKGPGRSVQFGLRF